MRESEIIQRGELLVLPCKDPAVEKVYGYTRLLVGLDIAQSASASGQNAISIIHDTQVPFWGKSGQELGPRSRTVVRTERIPAMAYTSLAQVTRNLMIDPAIAETGHLVVDAGGPGRAFADLLNTKGVQHTRMQIVSGENESETNERGVKFNNVARNLLLGTMNSALHTGELQIGDIPNRDALQMELESFEMKFSDAGRMKITGGTKQGHADQAIATSMALWLSDSQSVTATIGESKLRGYW